VAAMVHRVSRRTIRGLWDGSQRGDLVVARFGYSSSSRKLTRFVIPAVGRGCIRASGIHLLPTRFMVTSHPEIDNMDSRFRGNDERHMDSRFRGNDEGHMDSRFRGNDERHMDSCFRGNDEGNVDSRFRGNDEGHMDSRFRGNDGVRTVSRNVIGPTGPATTSPPPTRSSSRTATGAPTLAALSPWST